MKITKIDLPLVYPDPSEFVRPFPYRAPLAIAAGMKEIITGKTVCDIGCGEGDIMAQMAKYAKSVVGIEIDSERYQAAADRGLDVKMINFYECDLPEVEVYYSWTSFKLMTDIAEILFKKPNGFKLIFGGLQNSALCIQAIQKYGGEILEIPYLEHSVLDGFQSQGVWWLVILEKLKQF